MENIIYDSNRTLDIAVRIGVNMLKAGAEVSRVEKTMDYICKAFGAEVVDCFCLPTLLLVSATFEGKTYQSRIKRNFINQRDLYRLEKYNSLSREISKKMLDYESIEEKIDYIENKKDYSLYIIIIGAFFSCFGFALFFGGNIKDAFSAGIVGLIVYFISKIKLKHSNESLHILLSSLIGGLLCSLLYKIKLVDNLSSVMIGTIMLLIPGINISISIRDILIDDLLSGSIKFIQSIAISLAIAAGFSVWTLIFDVDIILELNPLSWMMLLGGSFGVFGFSIIFNSKYKRLPFAILVGIITTIVYMVCIRTFNLNTLFSNLIPAFIGGILAEILARIIKAPATSFYFPSIIPLVPGASLFFTMYHIITKNKDMFINTLGSTFISILAISLGIVAAQVIFANLPKINSKKI